MATSTNFLYPDGTAVGSYVDQVSQELIGRAVLEGKTIKNSTLITGVKYATDLHPLYTDIDPQCATCGWNEGSDDINLRSRTLYAIPLEVKMSLCHKELAQKYTGMWMRDNLTEVVPFEETIANQVIKEIKKSNDAFIWQGAASGSGLCDGDFDGLLDILDEEYTSNALKPIYVDNGGTPFTGAAATIIAEVNAMVAAIPVDILDKEDLVLYMPYNHFMTYTAALRAANMTHYPADNGNFEILVPGTNVRVIATTGLNNASVSNGTPWVLTYASNIAIGTGMRDGEEKFDLWYSRDNDELRINVQWSLGAQVYFPDLVVIAYHS